MTDKKQDTLCKDCLGCEYKGHFSEIEMIPMPCPKFRPAPKEPSEQDKRELEYVLGSKEPDKWKTSMCRCRLPVKDIPCSVDTFDCVGGCVRTVELWEVQERFDALTQKVKDLEAELKKKDERNARIVKEADECSDGEWSSPCVVVDPLRKDAPKEVRE